MNSLKIRKPVRLHAPIKRTIPKPTDVSSKNEMNDSESESESDSEDELEKIKTKHEMSDSENESESESDSEEENSEDEKETDKRVPVKDLPFREEEFESPNEFGVRLKIQIKCDGKCEKNRCICESTEERGIRESTALLPWQPQVIKWMIDREATPVFGVRGGINSAKMGLGKTLMSLHVIMREYALPNPPQYPTLIVCPKSNIDDPWIEQIVKFLGNTCPHLIFRQDIMGNDLYHNITLEQLQKYRIVITNYDTVKGIAKKYNLYESLFERDHLDRRTNINSCAKPTPKMMTRTGDIMLFNTPWRRIILDESADSISNPKTLAFYSMMCLWAERKWCLTGTPIRNRATDLFAQFRWLGFNKITVAKQFTESVHFRYGLDKCILAMSLEDAGIKLPEMEIKEIEIVLTDREKECYDYWSKATREVYNKWAIGRLNYVSVLTLFLLQRLACVAGYTVTAESSRDYRADEEEKVAFTEAQRKLNDMTSGLADWIKDKHGTAGIQSAKVSKVIEIIRDHIPADEKVIIFSNFKKVLDVVELAIRSELPETEYVMVDGDVTGEDGTRALNTFRKGSARVNLMSYKVGAMGLNLIEANHVIFMETVWTPAIHKQAAGRVYRVGQNKKVIIWQLIAKDTIETAMMIEICQAKQKLADSFLDGEGLDETGKNKKKKNTGNIDAKTLGRLLKY